MPDPTSRGLTVEDLAARWRVSPDKVRSWIKSGKLQAINTSSSQCGKPRYVVLPEQLAAFEQQLAAAAPVKTPRRPRRAAEAIDFYPD